METWSKVERYVRQFLSELKDEDLTRNIEFTIGASNGSMSLGKLMQHAANHGVHHRGQVALMLRLLGYAPGNFDMLIYYAGERSAPAS